MFNMYVCIMFKMHVIISHQHYKKKRYCVCLVMHERKVERELSICDTLKWK